MAVPGFGPLLVINDDRVAPGMGFDLVRWREPRLQVLRGVMLATGRVVVGGLGLGWFLNRVAEKLDPSRRVPLSWDQDLD